MDLSPTEADPNATTKALKRKNMAIKLCILARLLAPQAHPPATVEVRYG